MEKIASLSLPCAHHVAGWGVRPGTTIMIFEAHGFLSKL